MSQTSTIDPIQAAIAQAQAAAASVAAANAAPTNLPAVQQPAATAVAVPGRRMTADDFMNSGEMSVDQWLGVTFQGLVYGKEKKILTEMPKVAIDLDAVIYNQSIKYGTNPVQYRKTFDGVTDTRGGAWAQTCSQAQALDPRARPYPSADVPMTLLADVPLLGGGAAKAGTLMGYSLATTVAPKFREMVAQAAKQGITSGLVEVQLGHQPQSRNGNNWGLITFQLVGAFADELPARPAPLN